ncbi:MAG: 2-amino-4-hydroxy-6-hydroxymethyldihydropteridine diphosphokinase, partial [Chloroflexota bacterium]
AVLGRVPSFVGGPRSIDVDILFYEGLTMETADLTIPHPRVAERAFVLVPLLEIAPDMVHPRSGVSVRNLASVVEGKDGIEKIGELEGA